jgi:hypothetical protein
VDLSAVEAFVRVAESKSFTEAGRVMGLIGPGIHRILAERTRDCRRFGSARRRVMRRARRDGGHVPTWGRHVRSCRADSVASRFARSTCRSSPGKSTSSCARPILKHGYRVPPSSENSA